MYLRDATHQCNTVSTHLAHCVRWPWRVSAGLSKELRDSDTPHRVAADLTAAGDGSSAAILRTDVDGRTLRQPVGGTYPCNLPTGRGFLAIKSF